MDQPQTELGKYMVEFVKKLVAGETAYCYCDEPEERCGYNTCKNCGGFWWDRGYWLFE